MAGLMDGFGGLTPGPGTVQAIFIGVLILVGVCVLCGLMYFIYWMMMYKHRVLVLEKTGKGYIGMWEFMRLNQKADITHAYLRRWFNRGEQIKPPQDHQWMMMKGGKKICILRREGNTYMPLEVRDRESDSFLAYDEHDAAAFHLAKRKEISLKYNEKTFWDKYGSVISMAIMLVLIFAIFMMISDKLNVVAVALDHVASALQPVINSMGGPGVPGA